MLIGLKCQNREGRSSRSADLILFSALVFLGEGWGGRERRGAHAKGGFGKGRAGRARPQSPTARVSIGTLFHKMQLTAADRRGLSKILISKAFSHRVSGRGPAGRGTRRGKKGKKKALSPAHPTRPRLLGGGVTGNESLLYFKRKREKRGKEKAGLVIWASEPRSLERQPGEGAPAAGSRPSRPARPLLLPQEEADRRRPRSARDGGHNHLPLF